MVNPNVVATRLAKLREYVGYLKTLRKHSFKEFVADPFIRGSVERYLQLAIECCLDLGNHLIADRGLRRAEDYKEVFLILGEAGFIPKPFSRKIAPMGGFRNILVHDYLKVDPRKVYEALHGHLADIERFARFIAKTLR